MRRSIRTRRSRKKVGQAFELQLTSMMDVLVIIVVFLLKSYATTMNNFTSVPGIKIPISKSQDEPSDSLQVIITPENMTFENQKILEFIQTASAAGSADSDYEFKKQDLDEGSRRIVPLYDALMKAREKAEVLREKSKARDAQGRPLPFEGILAIQADKRVQYDTIRKIMYTAAAAGYKTFRFLALKQDS
ncbi:MAG: biopolymer transporter ExbD [Oligoflexia bacterium]|nr:biopolymer transporter ExbD [Oligoflexia bacterium]